LLVYGIFLAVCGGLVERSQFKFLQKGRPFFSRHAYAGGWEKWKAYLQPNTFIPYSKAANVLAIVGLLLEYDCLKLFFKGLAFYIEM